MTYLVGLHDLAAERLLVAGGSDVELDAETWAMGIDQGDLSKNTTLLGYIYHLPPERTMRISESQPCCKNQLWLLV